MSSVQLLDKTRKIGKLLHNNNSGKVVFNDICEVLKEILASNVLVISRKGKVLGIGDLDSVESITELIVDHVGGFIDPMLNERLLGVLSTKENVNLETLGFENIDTRKFQAVIAPIEISGERLGTLFLYKCEEQYDIDDIILCEYGTTVVGLEMLRAVSEESAEENRKIAVVKSAISTLSFSEMEATPIFSKYGFVFRHSGNPGQARNLPCGPYLMTICLPQTSQYSSESSSAISTSSSSFSAFCTASSRSG